MEFKPYNLRNFREIPQIRVVSEAEKRDIEIVAHVFPFKTNNYVINELIDWKNYKDDPIYTLNFPRREMLLPEHFKTVEELLNSNAEKPETMHAVNEIRLDLNPHPAGQLEHNVPVMDGKRLPGIQHKYKETVLFFPSQGQSCHAYCTFCFRWPQFTAIQELRFSMKEAELLVEYIRRHEEVTDLLITGGDPMVMNYTIISRYINAILDADIPHLKNLRIGTKSLSFWPYRFLTEPDSENILNLFKLVNDSGIHLALMAHFSHPVELSTTAVQEAIGKIRNTGAQIRTQSPVLNRINANENTWSDMWKKQVHLGMIPYYMFVARDTGAKHFFSIPLFRVWEIYRNAYKQVSGICRTVRGPSMSSNPGKVRIIGVARIGDEKVFVLNFIQGRNPEWVGQPFFAKYNEKAYWLTDLKPAFNEEEFFYSKEFRKMLKIEEDTMNIFDELQWMFRKGKA